MEIHAFNTGRRYTEAGQRIAWTIIDTEYVVAIEAISYIISFVDYDRLIDGTVHIVGEPTNADVLRAYDMGGYGYDTDMDRKRILRKAAGEVEGV